MKDFIQRMQTIVQEASDFLKNKVLEEGKVIVLAELEDGGFEDDDAFYELPFVGNYGKYGTYDEYAILSLEARDGEVIVHTKGRGEADDDKEFLFSQIEDVQLCFLADLI